MEIGTRKILVQVTMTQGSVKMVVASTAQQTGQEIQQQQPQQQMVTTSYPQPQFFQTTPVTTTIQRGQPNATATTVHFDPIRCVISHHLLYSSLLLTLQPSTAYRCWLGADTIASGGVLALPTANRLSRASGH